tara:strand:- start:2127 stop:3818 length:1692 start_codon:yes stop_codon:yes gene_type:complete
MKSNIFSWVLLLGIAYMIHSWRIVQLSEKEFFNDYHENTTRIDIYNKEKAYIRLHNQNTYSHYMYIQNITDFVNNMDSSMDIHHKTSRAQEMINIALLLFFIGCMVQARQHLGIGGSIYTENKVSTRLKDVAGLELQKREVFEFVDFLKHREKYKAMGARMPRGALFHGPPGTGKTLLAKAVAGECDVSFLSVAGPDFSEMFVGVGASRVRDLFKKARKKAPCIIFIDEIDALARSRHNMPGMGHQEKENTLNRLLIELDGFTANDKVLIFGATNRLDMLDKALMRPGRFDRKIQFELPERQEREKIFQHYLNKMQLEKGMEGVAAHLAKQCFGFSCADIANICNEASILAVRNNQTTVSRRLLEEAIDTTLLGHEKRTFQLSEQDKKIVAYHESGHTLVSYLLLHVNPPVKVSIIPRDKGSLGFSMNEISESKLKNQDELVEKICVLLGGRIAEEVFIGSITTGASDDIQRLTQLAYQYIGLFGMDKEISTFHYDGKLQHYSEDLRKKVDHRVQELIHTCYDRTKRLIEDNKPRIEAMARALLEKEILNQEDIELLFRENKF